MRTLMLPLALLLATPAWADGYRGRHGSGDGPRRDEGAGFRDTRFDQAFAVVTNPNAEPVEIRIDRDRVAVVSPGATVRVGPLAVGVHDYAARFVDRLDGLRVPLERQQIVLDGRHPARLGVPLAAESIVAFENRWMEPMTVVVDGQPGRQVAPGATGRVLARVGAAVEITGPHGELAMQYRVRQGGLQTEWFALVAPPVARVTVFNPTSAPLEVLDSSGRAVGYVPAGRQDLITVAAGAQRLQARFQGRTVDVAQLVVSPFRANSWAVQPPSTAFLDLRNDQPFALTVLVDGRVIGQVGPRARQIFEGLPVGAGRVEVLADDGRRGQASTWLTFDPLFGATWAPVIRVGDGRGAVVAWDGPTRRDGTVVWRRYGR